PDYVRLADSARAPRDDTFSPRAHSSSLSKHLGHRSIVCRERNYRLTSPVQQRWPDKPNSLFRGQAPSLRLHHRWLCYGALALLLLAVGKLVVYDYGEVFAFRLETFAYAQDFAEHLLERWSTVALVLGALLYSAHMLRVAEPGLPSWQSRITTWLYGAFAILLFCVLTLE